jgi:hypothetical protein
MAPAAISVIRARYRPESRSARESDQRADQAGDDAGDEDEQRERQGGGVVEPQRDPGADGQQQELAERHHAGPADQQPEAQGHDAVDHDRGHDLQPEPVEIPGSPKATKASAAAPTAVAPG